MTCRCSSFIEQGISKFGLSVILDIHHLMMGNKGMHNKDTHIMHVWR